MKDRRHKVCVTATRIERQIQTRTDAHFQHDAASRGHMRPHAGVSHPRATSRNDEARKHVAVIEIRPNFPYLIQNSVTGKVTRKTRQFSLTSNCDALEFPPQPFHNRLDYGGRSMKQRLGLGILLGLAMLLMVPAVSSAQSAIVGLADGRLRRRASRRQRRSRPAL